MDLAALSSKGFPNVGPSSMESMEIWKLNLAGVCQTKLSQILSETLPPAPSQGWHGQSLWGLGSRGALGGLVLLYPT